MCKKYSSGLISQSFWFIEIKKIIKLISEGKTDEEIKKICLEENLFGTSNEYRAKRMYGYIWKRVKCLDKNILELFLKSDISTQKIINLIAILKNDRLFFEFMFEVYREKIILGSTNMENSDISIFFRNKDIQSEEIAKWTDITKKKLTCIYTNFLMDANLLTGKDKEITPPVLDISLEQYLKLSGDEILIKAITGVN